jgi:hypothetical protein
MPNALDHWDDGGATCPGAAFMGAALTAPGSEALATETAIGLLEYIFMVRRLSGYLLRASTQRSPFQ